MLMFPGTFTETLLATNNNFLIKFNKINHFSCNFTVMKVFLKCTFGVSSYFSEALFTSLKVAPLKA